MGILSRFKDIMASNINALLDRAEDPEKMIDQCLRNLNSDLGKVKSETAAIMAEEARAKRDMEECQGEANKMQTYAIKALEANNEADARKFLEQKASLSSKLEGLTSSYELAHTNATNMRSMHDKLVRDIEELESRRDMIKGKLAVAKTQERINKMQSSVGNANNSINSFNRFEDLANKKLDQANAMAELNASGPDNEINDLKSKYSLSSDVDDELAALKASLSK